MSEKPRDLEPWNDEVVLGPGLSGPQTGRRWMEVGTGVL